MPLEKLKKFLDDNHIEYVIISHSRAFTAQKIAAASHIKGKDIAKTVMIRVNGKLAMAVLPASTRVNFPMLREMIGGEVALAHEDEFSYRFPNCETGAMPPFGNLFDMDVYVAEKLVGDHLIAFNAGSHSELIQLPYRDFERLVKPKIMRFSVVMA